MKRLMLLKILLFIFSCAVLNVHAEEYPKATKLDKRLREVVYNENQVYKVKMQVGINSHLIFSKGEVFEKWYSGDNEAFVLTSHKNYVIFKPVVEQSKTNLFIITNKRHYNLSVEISKNNGFYGIRFLYPEFERNEKQRLFAEKRDEERIKNQLKRTIDPELQRYKNKQYWAAGSNNIRPDKIFDNGLNTFFHFPEFKEFPAIYRMQENAKGSYKEKLTQFSVHKNWIIVPKVQERWRLRLGGSVLCIQNRNFAPRLKDKKTETTSNKVIRTVHQEEENNDL